MHTRRTITTAVLAAVAATAAAVPAAHAQSSYTLTFEGLGDLAQVGSFYDGGAGGGYGVAFDTTAYATVSGTAGGYGGFQGAPSGTTALFFDAASSTYVNRSAGFTSFTLSYAAVLDPGTVSVYSGLNGTGTLLGTTTLAVTPSGGGTAACPAAATDYPYCPFALAAVAFAGTARSVVFGGAANAIVFDDLTFGGAAAVVPEPGTFALAAAGLGALAAARRRRSPHA